MNRKTFLSWLIIPIVIFLMMIGYSLWSQSTPTPITRTITQTLQWTNPDGFDSQFWNYEVQHSTDNGQSWQPSTIVLMNNDGTNRTQTDVSIDVSEDQSLQLMSRVRLFHQKGHLWGPWAVSDTLPVGLDSTAVVDGIQTINITVVIQP